jgi:eukaryotic-like serine/threonine-protein kinase
MEFRRGEPVLAGKYRLKRRLGQGSMGTVWQADHIVLRAPVAIKLMDPVLAQNTEAVTRFLREARAAATVRSPHVVQILDYGVDDATPYIAMELLEGETLGAKLERVSCLSPTETAQIVVHVGRAIGRVHESGIIHRDLKPDNIFLVPNDDEVMAKLLDFGIAKTAANLVGSSGGPGTRTGTLLGTALYMSPEQAQALTDVDHRTDIWAIGAIAFECLTGRHAFHGETLTSIVLAICAREPPIPSRFASVPDGFDAWFSRACARDRNLRFGSAKEAAAELKRVCESAREIERAASFGSTPPVGAKGSPAQRDRNTAAEGRAGRSSLVWESATDPPPVTPSNRTKLAVAPYAGVLFGLACLVAGGAIGARFVRNDGASSAAATAATGAGSDAAVPFDSSKTLIAVPDPAASNSAARDIRSGATAASSPRVSESVFPGTTLLGDAPTKPSPAASDSAAHSPAAPGPAKSGQLTNTASESSRRVAPKGPDLELRSRR